ncbi:MULTISPECIES: DUF3597 family protein [unclassified Pseudomonas]|uniref:DUF3597 family protein n=1 Tax=unclassified Pseudomonas TaxID=196821 RepID=UPI0008C3A1C9|nr:DUF3597 family protein [Pseudomonas sp. NFR16]SEJ64878.1 protein of unknown function [Pseudomonas sp. NFR16]
MSILSTILEKLGIGSASATPQAAPEPSAVPPTGSTASSTGTPAGAPAAPSADQVTAKLESLSQAHPELKPQNSIVDLLKALGLDSSFEHRKELAKEVGIDPYEGSAEQNLELHKAVLQKASQ